MKKYIYSRHMNAKRQILLFFIIISSIFLNGCSGKTTPQVYRVGILYESDILVIAADGFIEKMTELGYIQGGNIIYDKRMSDSSPDHNIQIASEFVKNKVDLIFAFPLMAALAARSATEGTDIPVIFSISGLEGNNLVKSVREPGGNITGVRSPITEIPVKSFEIMLQFVPRMKRLYVPYAANYPAILPGLNALNSAAAANNVTIVEVPVTTLKELEADLSERDASIDIGIDAILCMPETLVQSLEGFIKLRNFAEKHRIPIGGITPWHIREGAVFVSGLDIREMGRLAAPLADKVLKGTKAGSIPVVSPELYLRINYKRARELGISVPEGLLLQAIEIIR